MKNIKCNTKLITAAALLGLVLGMANSVPAAESAERASETKKKIQDLRSGSARVRNQIAVTLEELNRMTVKGVELRPQFEKFKAEVAKMEAEAKLARDRADSMKEKGEGAFQAWETEVSEIRNADIRKEAQKRYDKRKKSYDRIIASMQDAKSQLVPFMSDLKDISKLLDSELTQKSVNSTKSTIRTAGWHGEDVRDSLLDVEKELDRVAADLAKYQ